MRRSGFGISVDVPSGWTSAIVRRPVPPETAPAPPPEARGLAPAAPAEPGERTLPVVHVCTRPLPTAVGDFGSGVIELLTPEDVFVSLVEYGSDLAGFGLFERQGWPRLAPSQFSPNRMFREVPGRSGSQHFFSVGGRAFCLFTVVGSHSRRMATVPRAAGVVRSLAVEPASVMARRGVVV
ncbi:hypothetical protein [Oryzobacter telluris]|uniref:hypothetical protein n=1 Tax=Oryzobacter telluris TaxID=3149179 RepID=UPI00370D458C